MLKNKNLGRYSIKPLTELSTRIASICDANDLTYCAEFGRTKADKPYLKYEIRLEGKQAVLFGTTITSANDEYTEEVLKAVRGETVSPVSPPAMRTWGDEIIYYWKRLMVVEQTQDADTGMVTGSSSYSTWVGYSKSNKEICRVKDGASNPNYWAIDRVDVVDLGPLGKVFAVVPHWKETPPDHNVATMGEHIRFKEVMEQEKRKAEQEKMALQIAHNNSRLEQAGSSMGTAPNMSTQAISELMPPSFVKMVRNPVPLNNLKNVVGSTDISDKKEFDKESISPTIEVNTAQLEKPLVARWYAKPDERYFDADQKELLGTLSECTLPHEVKVALVALHGTFTSVGGMAFDLIDGQSKISDAISNYIPVVLSDCDFEVLTDEARFRYNARINCLIAIASSKEVREDGSPASGLICDFLTKVAKTDMFLAGYLIKISRTQFDAIENLPSLIDYTASIYEYPEELTAYLFSPEVRFGQTNTHFIAPSKVDDVAKVLRLPLENMWALLTPTGWTIGDPVGVDPKYSSMLYGKLNIEQRFF